ncbi:MAG: glycosyltransferase family 2 protein [Bacteroidales bacterium]
MAYSNPLISVITPTYNHEKFIADCIESVLGQSFQNWEMIIVDDGSTDSTAQIVARYSQEDPRIHLISQSNTGIFRLAETYNKALRMAKGKYIAILEGDDYWLPHKLDIQFNTMETNANAVLCWSRAASRLNHENHTYQVHPINIASNKQYYNNSPVGSIFNVIFDDFLPPLTYFIRKESLDKIGGFSQVLPFPAVDLSTLLAISLQGQFVFIDEILGTWRLNPNQATKTYINEIVEGSHKIILSHYKQVEKLPLTLKFDHKFIANNYRRRKIISHARSGRFMLIRKKFKDARREYIKAIVGGGFKEPMWKIRAMVGFVFSLFHCNVEGFARLLGKKYYSPE